MGDIRPLTDTFAVAPQLEPHDVADIAAAGYRTIICNRPDVEAPTGAKAVDIRAAAEKAGLAFVDIPFVGAPRDPQINALTAALMDHAGPILSYCRTGTRSATLWAIVENRRGRLSSRQIVDAGAQAGYDLTPFAGEGA